MERLGDFLPRYERRELDPPPASEPGCPVCNDKGFLYPRDGYGPGAKPVYSQLISCDCQAKGLAEVWIRAADLFEIPPGLRYCRFDNFRALPGTEQGLSVAAAMGRGEGEWLTLTGPPGTGKTHLGVAIIQAWHSRRQAAIYQSAPILLDNLRRAFDPDTRGAINSTSALYGDFARYCQVPLLVLDNVGVEHPTPWANERLETLVDYRYTYGLPLVVTTDLPLDRLPPRIASRLMRREGSQIVSMTRVYQR